MTKKLILFLSLMLVAGITLDASAQVKKDKEKDKKDKTKTDSVKNTVKESYAKLLKNPQKTVKGLMNMYYVKSKLYLEIPVKILDKDLLLASTISETSDNLNGIVGSKPQTPLQVKFLQIDSAIVLTKIIKDAIAPDDDKSLNQALDKNSIGAIMEKFDILAYNPDRSAVVIDVTNFFIGDNKELSPFGAFRMNVGGSIKGSESFKRDRSFLGEIKAFDDNVTIKSYLTYENTINDDKRYYAKDKPFTTVMTRTFLLLPEKPVRARTADSRIGIFVTGKYKLSSDINKTEVVYFANKWNLVPKDVAAYKRGELVEPVKPITFYVDSDFPESWKETVKAAINDWRLTFEAIGFKNAIVALDYPKDDPQFDPDNLKYNCVRYAPTPVANAIGPSWVDPRSGEIINASVYVFHDIVKLLNNWMFIQTSPADKAIRGVTLPESYKNNGIKYVVRHEIGHCLGFMHNFGASSAIPVDSLRSPSFTQKYGTTYSIMDYARFNYVAQPGDKERGVSLSPPTFGLYDYYLTKWNYTYFDNTTVTEAQEKEILAKMIADKAGDIRYRYGAQGKGTDPTSLSEDLGDDAVKASEYGVKNLKYIMKNLNDWVGAQDKDYEYRSEIWEGILSQYTTYINHVLANIGGIVTNDKYVGDPRPMFESTPRAKQIAAMDFLLKEIKDLDWLEDKNVLDNMPLTGTPATLLRGQVVEVLMQTPLMVSLSALKSKEPKPFTPEEAMDRLYAAVWNSTLNNKVPDQADRDMQKSFVKSSIKNAKLVPAGKANALAINADGLQSIVTLPEFIKKNQIQACGCSGDHNHASFDPVAGFGPERVNFQLSPDLDSAYFVKLKEAQKLLEKAVKRTADKETEMHYKLLLSQINKVLN